MTAPLVSWHRGGRELAPSATFEAFEAAARHGAEFIEVDVRRTRDGVLVCVHDDSVLDVGRVVDIDFAALTETQRQGILTFDRFCEMLDQVDPDRRCGVHLDLKDTGYELESVDRLAQLQRRFFATSLIESSVRTIRTQRPRFDAYLSIGTSRFGLSRVQVVRLRLSEIFPMRQIARCQASGIAIHYRLATRWVRWWCRRHSLAIVVWTVDKPAFVETWLQRDIDVLTTNRPIFALSRREALTSVST